MTPSRPRPNATHRQRLAIVAVAPVLVALCLTFAAVRSSAAPSSPQQQVRVAWARLKDAFVHRNPSRVCGMLTPRARRGFVAVIYGLRTSPSCKVAVAGVIKGRGNVSDAAHAQLLSVAVHGNTAATQDTTGLFEAQWVRTEKATWKVCATPPGDLLPFTDKARDRSLGQWLAPSGPLLAQRRSAAIFTRGSRARVAKTGVAECGSDVL
jgi:hypothetical protein